MLPRLAYSFRSLTNQFMLTGMQEAAVSAMEECVSACRQLANAQPEEYLPSLASGLQNLALLHKRLERPSACILAASEASDLYDELRVSQPQRFTKCLAGSLETLGEGLASLERANEARQAISKAVRLRRLLAAAEPSELPGLARCLTMLGDVLNVLGRKDQARIAFRQVGDIEKHLGMHALPHGNVAGEGTGAAAESSGVADFGKA
jgi:hypothetical protein